MTSTTATIPAEYTGSRALDLFRLGMDTADLADFYGIKEWQAHELVTRQRAIELGISSGYPDPRPSWPRGRIKAA